MRSLEVDADSASPRGSRAALRRYLASATLARSADGGAGLGLVLLALQPQAHLHRPAAVAGLLVAALSAPHLAGPLVARRLDAAADGRRILAIAFTAYAAFLAATALLFGHVPIAVIGATVVAAGLCGPLLTGGLSSRLQPIAGTDPTAQRRAEGWDAVSYGLAGTAGPALVAALAAVSSPTMALLGLCIAATAAAGLVRTLPSDAADGGSSRAALTVRAALRVVAGTGPLRRVSYATMVTALTGGGLSLIAVALGGSLSSWHSAGAVLAASFGAGNLIGSVLVTIWPLRGEPEKLTSRFVAVMGMAYLLCAAAPTYSLALVAFTLAGATNAPFFTATLAARSSYAPANARAQIFVSIAGLKIAAAAAGTALTGSLLGHGPRMLLVLGAVLVGAAVLATTVDRRRWPARQPSTARP